MGECNKIIQNREFEIRRLNRPWQERGDRLIEVGRIGGFCPWGQWERRTLARSGAGYLCTKHLLDPIMSAIKGPASLLVGASFPSMVAFLSLGRNVG